MVWEDDAETESTNPHDNPDPLVSQEDADLADLFDRSMTSGAVADNQQEPSSDNKSVTPHKRPHEPLQRPEPEDSS